MASSASTTSSQRSATTEPISFHSFSPLRPVKASCPADSRLKPSVEFSTSSIASRPHTSASDRRMAMVSVKFGQCPDVGGLGHQIGDADDVEAVVVIGDQLVDQQLGGRLPFRVIEQVVLGRRSG